MNLNETIPGNWWLHSAIGGGLLLLLTAVLMAVTRQPARRQRLGEWGVTAALVVAVLCLAPAWLLVPVSQTYQAKPQAATPNAAVEERPAPAPPATPPAPEAPAGMSDPGAVALQLPPPQAPAKEPADGRIENPSHEVAPLPAASAISLTTLCHWLVVAYVVVAALLLARWLWQYVRLWRLLRAARPAPPAGARLFREMASGLTP